MPDECMTFVHQAAQWLSGNPMGWSDWKQKIIYSM